jgi:hypothetical protein
MATLVVRFGRIPPMRRASLRFMALSYDCAKARAPYESARAGENTNQHGTEDDDGDDPHENLMRIIEGWIEADKAEKAERMMIDVSPVPESAAPETKPNPHDEGIDGEMA